MKAQVNSLCGAASTGWVALCALMVGLILLPIGVTARATPRAAGGPALAGTSSFAATQPLGDLLNPDGTLNLPDGFSGSADAQGWRLVSGPGEAPRFASAVSDDVFWADNFGPVGTDESVAALVADGAGNLYAGGAFTETGGVTVNHIAMWDGSSWSPLGSGMDGAVYALAVDGSGNLYAGGNFTQAGGVSVKHIAMWDGSSWSPLGWGVGDTVLALAMDGSGNLYAGGQFIVVEGGNANYVARWDGSSWYGMGGGMNNWVTDLAVDGSDNLYAGGWFTEAGGGRRTLWRCGTAPVGQHWAVG